MNIFKLSFDKDDVLSFILCNRFQAESRDRSVLTSRDERMISAWVHSDPDLSRLNSVRQSSWLNLYNNFHNFNNCSDKKGHPRQKWKFGENFNAINFHWILSSKSECMRWKNLRSAKKNWWHDDVMNYESPSQTIQNLLIERVG